MSSEPDDESRAILTDADGFGSILLARARPEVASLASEVLNLVARRAVNLRRGKDREAVTSASIALTSGTEQEAAAALESLDDNLRGLDWFLAERLGPIAKEIGALWNEDRISFLEATVGASRIYTYIRYRRRPPVPIERALRRSATFILVPGDMHTLGISAATDVCRSKGWDITLLVGHSHQELVAHFEQSTDTVYGFSAGTTLSLGALGRLVVALTVAHPDVHVLVSGQIAQERDEVMALPGVDACEPELEAAYAWLDALKVDQGA